jgi:hypothetical protein
MRRTPAPALRWNGPARLPNVDLVGLNRRRLHQAADRPEIRASVARVSRLPGFTSNPKGLSYDPTRSSRC